MAEAYKRMATYFGNRTIHITTTDSHQYNQQANSQKAMEYYLKSVEQSNAKAQTALGIIYFSGILGKKR